MRFHGCASGRRRAVDGWSTIVFVALLALGTAPIAVADPPTQRPLCSAPFQGAAAASADAANPLGLLPAPGPDPLTRASFYVPGPAYGHAAGEIAQLLHDQGASTLLPAAYGNESWAAFEGSLHSPPLADRIAANPTLATDIPLLEKIAREPETARFTIYTAGGGPGAIYSNVQKFLCRIQRERDSGPYGFGTVLKPMPAASVPRQPSLPLISTYFLSHQSPCTTLFMTPDGVAAFQRHVTELAHALYGWSAVVLVELDAVDTAPCLSPKGLAQRFSLLRWMVNEIHQDDPHVVQYVEGGADDAVCVGFAIQALEYVIGRTNAVGNPTCAKKSAKSKKKKPKGKSADRAHVSAEGAVPSPVRGFFLGDTHFDWASKEVAFGEQIYRATGLHFIVTTQDSGNGPDIPKNGKVRGGNEVLCNPPGAGLGPRPTAATGLAARGVDAFEWSGTPGLSGGTGPGCNGVTTPSGLFDLGFALQLARRANDRIGPSPTYRSMPY